MSNAKPLKNGHAPAKTLSQSQSAIRNRRSRERRKRGAIVLKSLLIEPSLISALVEHQRLSPIERGNRQAVEHALAALIQHAINFGATPGRPSVPIDLETVEAAWVWNKPNLQPTPENASKAIRTAIRCGQQMGVTPQAYASVMRERLGIN